MHLQWTILVAGGSMNLFPLGDSIVLKANVTNVSEERSKHRPMHVPSTKCQVSAHFLL